ncbi:MAG TPA: pyruvate ferredoxin oxidoreductase [Deltaproteobacteria bacterium]|nr:pyruvate ferredoxin oxidoreductase [Deltaproteobacteria bacterium]HPR54052.1 pyruvate ferredoxin oxidoreductase [Deltaproteobacteria bacterium]HXK46832.1 pyruvate ferredoxin oxidoreductase [Deltaproteobacteria bacterium]
MHIIESGNVAAALGVKLCRAQVIAAYPITPQTPLTERLSELVESGEMEAEYIPVESEHSALAVCIAASSTGARAFTATSANGLLYMHEQIHWAAGARLPLVMCVVNRGVGAPWTIWNDHQDSISQRDTGWMQLYVNDHQQIIDGVIKAYMLAEEVMAPIMLCYDGYLLSHTYMPFDVPSQEEVDAFLPPYKPAYALNPDSPANLNTVTLPDVRPDTKGKTAHGYMEIRYLLQEDLLKAIDVMGSVESRFKEHFGRGGNPYYETYRCEDARFIAVSLGSLSYHLREVIDRVREDGIKAGIMSIHLYRPFPADAIARVLVEAEGVIVFEKALSYGYEGALCSDVKAALYQASGSKKKRPFVHNHILGLGGREIKTVQLYEAMQHSCTRGTKVENALQWIGLKI